MTLIKPFFLKTESGYEMDCNINNFMQVTILLIDINFNPYKHIDFAYSNICALDGVKMLTGATATGKNRGIYQFLLIKGIDLEILKKEIKHEFENYFLHF